jgi:predicted TIM-barrel fold metal-dependent hydrolase
MPPRRSNPKIHPLGDAALLVELGRRLDTALNTRALNLAAALRRQRGVREAVAGYSTVVVHYDPEVASFRAVTATVKRLADSGRVWVKLSGPYLDSRAGVDGAFKDVASIAKAWATALPERVVWGSDWPHTTESNKPDDVELLDLLGQWATDEAVRERILVTNPAELYGFGR